MKNVSTVLLLLFFTNACTMVGFHNHKEMRRIDYGNSMPLRICVLKDKGITDRLIYKRLSFWQKELSLYNIEIEHTNTRSWQRNGFNSNEILKSLYHPLPKKCDRLVAFVSTTWKDVGYEILTVFLSFGMASLISFLTEFEIHITLSER